MQTLIQIGDNGWVLKERIQGFVHDPKDNSLVLYMCHGLRLTFEKTPREIAEIIAKAFGPMVKMETVKKPQLDPKAN